MAEEIDPEKCTFRNFGSSVTLTLTLDRVEVTLVRICGRGLPTRQSTEGNAAQKFWVKKSLISPNKCRSCKQWHTVMLGAHYNAGDRPTVKSVGWPHRPVTAEKFSLGVLY